MRRKDQVKREAGDRVGPPREMASRGVRGAGRLRPEADWASATALPVEGRLQCHAVGAEGLDREGRWPRTHPRRATIPTSWVWPRVRCSKADGSGCASREIAGRAERPVFIQEPRRTNGHIGVPPEENAFQPACNGRDRSGSAQSTPSPAKVAFTSVASRRKAMPGQGRLETGCKTGHQPS